ncbi:unnamed protein product [Soboliphyme baturini]|uniref:Ovule protein n=1 Tax=Soboliphyme baturini TaxID=241478 RepID=A0A183IFB5_9BILA|nr:unnamed protein product [Soboliphyme baturini]
MPSFENDARSKDLSLVDKKRLQWEKERGKFMHSGEYIFANKSVSEEQQVWFPFGRSPNRSSRRSRASLDHSKSVNSGHNDTPGTPYSVRALHRCTASARLIFVYFFVCCLTSDLSPFCDILPPNR